MKTNEAIILMIGFLSFGLISFLVFDDVYSNFLFGLMGMLIIGFILYLNDIPSEKQNE